MRTAFPSQVPPPENRHDSCEISILTIAESIKFLQNRSFQKTDVTTWKQSRSPKIYWIWKT